jgi:hypothetical protein
MKFFTSHFSNRKIYLIHLIFLLLFSLILSCNNSLNSLEDKNSLAETAISTEDGEIDDFPIVKGLKVTSKQETFSPENGGVISLDDKIKIEIPAGSLKEETTFYIFHGFILDELGEDQYNESNRQLLNESIIEPLDVFEISMSGDNFTGSMKIEMSYDQKLLDRLNNSLTEVVTGFDGFHENELGIFYMDKTGGRWISFNNIVDEENNRININSQYAGVYVLAIKPEAFARLGKYIKDNPGSLNYDAALLNEENKDITGIPASCGSKSITPDYKPKIDPTVGKEDETVTGFTSPCTNPGAYVDWLFRGTFTKPCLRHDWCYRYGNWTYEHSRIKCDMDFLRDNLKGCRDKFLPKRPSKMNCKKIKLPYCSRYKCGMKPRNICKYNPFYWIWLTTKMSFYLPCTSSAKIMYGFVAVFGGSSFQEAKSGCIDYKNKGRNCEIARIYTIMVRSDNKQISLPEDNSIKLEAIITAATQSSKKPTSISWRVEPDRGDLSWESSDIDKFVEWKVLPDIPLGIYKFTATIYEGNRAISSQVKYISVVDAVIETVDDESGSKTYKRGEGNFNDISERIGADDLGNIYVTYTKTFENIIHWTTVESRSVKKTKKKCKKINLGFGKIKYKCKTKTYYVTEYYNVPHSRTEYYTKKFLSKFNSNNVKLWDSEIEKLPVKSININNSGDILLTRSNELLIFNGSGVILDRINSISGEIEEVLVNETIYYIISKDMDNSQIGIMKFNNLGMSEGEPEIIFNNAEYGSAKIKDDGIFITAHKKGDESKLYVAKIDLDCNILLFIDFDVTGEAALANIDTGNNGDIYLTGYSPGKFIDSELTEDREAFIMALDIYGEKKWIKKLSRFKEGTEIKIDIDDTNEIILTGNRDSVSNNIIGIVKYDIEGNFLQAKTIDNSYGDMTQTGSIMVDNNLYITGTQNTGMSVDRDWFYLRMLEY